MVVRGRPVHGRVKRLLGGHEALDYVRRIAGEQQHACVNRIGQHPAQHQFAALGRCPGQLQMLTAKLAAPLQIVGTVIIEE